LLGNGDTANSSVPVAAAASGIGNGKKFIALASGPSASHGMALTAIPLSPGSTLAPCRRLRRNAQKYHPGIRQPTAIRTMNSVF